MDLFPDCFVSLNIQPCGEAAAACIKNQFYPQKYQPFQFHKYATFSYQNSHLILRIYKLNFSNVRMVYLRLFHFACQIAGNR